MNENSTLEDAVVGLKEDLTSLNEVTKEPFKSSESAIVITNETDVSSKYSAEAESNIFLTEDVIRLAQNQNT